MSGHTPQLVFADTDRVQRLRRRVRAAMGVLPVAWDGPAQIDEPYMAEPLPVRKARAIALKLSRMPTDLWEEQLLAGSMTLEEPRLHAERGFPVYTTQSEREVAASLGLSSHSVFGHIVPDYPTLLHKGLRGIAQDAQQQRSLAQSADEMAFLDSVVVAVEAVADLAGRLAERCELEANGQDGEQRAEELYSMAANLRACPDGPAETFWQGLQAIWLLHMVFHSTLNGNALGRVDQYLWPYLEADLLSGRLTIEQSAELVDCFCLKFNERAQTTEDLVASARPAEGGKERRTRHYTSSQMSALSVDRDRLDATNHWLQNIVIGGLTPEGEDGTNLLSFLLLDSYRRNEMTNPLLTVRVHRGTPPDLLVRVCETLKAGGGMPAIFSDEAIVPAVEGMGIPERDALDYTNDGCWEVIIPGRTDFCFQRLSLMLCLEWALNRGRSWLDGQREGLDTGDARDFVSYDQVWGAFLSQLDRMIEQVVTRVAETANHKSTIAPVPLLSALIDGTIENRCDMTAGGAKYRTFGMLAESAAHAIDSLTAIKSVVFEQGQATMTELCDALDADFVGYEALRAKLLAAPKYGNDDERADAVGRELMGAFTELVEKHARAYQSSIRFPCGVGTFSWYIGIGEGLGASADGRKAGMPVSSNFAPALGRDLSGIPGAILSYAKMHHCNLPAGGPLDLRLARRLVEGQEGTERMVGLIRGFVDLGGAMMTLTVADTSELHAAQQHPEQYESLRVRMGGWCAYFTMLSREQQDHHIRRQEGDA